MKELTILISDRNRNVREYLRREIMTEGYQVRLAKSAREILEWIYTNESIDLVIMDPELPDIGETRLFEKIADRVPPIPLIVHAFSNDYAGRNMIPNGWSFVEKGGNSIEPLKNVIRELVRV